MHIWQQPWPRAMHARMSAQRKEIETYKGLSIGLAIFMHVRMLACPFRTITYFWVLKVSQAS